MKVRYKGVGNLCYFLAYDLFIALNILQSSNVDFMVNRWMRYGVAFLIMLLLVIKMICRKKITVRIIAKWMFFIVVSLIPIIHSYTTPLLVMMLILAYDDIHQEEIILRMQIGLIVWSMIVFCLCAVGVLTDYVYVHLRSGMISTVHSYGFKYYSTIGYIVMAELMVYILQKKEKCKWIELIVILIVNYLLYKIHTTTLAFYTVILYVFAYVIFDKIKLFNLKMARKIWMFIAVAAPWSAFGITMVAVFLYRKSGLSQLLRIFNGNQLIARLGFTSQAIDMYGIKLFGNRVEVFGQTAFVYGGAKTAFYIDSGYMYCLIVYGIIFTILILSMYSMTLKYIYKEQEDSVFLYMLLITMICIVNNFVLSATYNPLLLMGGNAIINDSVSFKENKIVVKHKNHEWKSQNRR